MTSGVPFGTVSSRPSTVEGDGVGVGGAHHGAHGVATERERRCGARVQRACADVLEGNGQPPSLDVPLELLAEALDASRAPAWRRRRRAGTGTCPRCCRRSASRRSISSIVGDALLDAAQRAHGPARALAARRALAAATRGGRTPPSAGRAAPCRCASSITITAPEPAIVPAAASASMARPTSRPLGPQERRRRAARDDRLELAALGTPPPQPSIRSPQGRGQRQLVVARALRRGPRARGRACPSTARCRSRRTARRPSRRMYGHRRERLDVVQQRRLLERAGDGRERRLGRRLAAVAVERGQQRRLLAADVGAGAAVQHDLGV